MKGHLYRKIQPKGWYVAYTVDIDSYAKTELPLHPDNVRTLNEWEQRFDNLEARIAANSEVEFEIVKEILEFNERSGTVQTWARIIDPPLDENGYPEVEGTMAICNDIIDKDKQKGILVELMELDNESGLYEPKPKNKIQKLTEEEWVAANNKVPQTELPDPGKDIADYIDRHIVESMKEMANEGLLKKLQIPEISDEEIEKVSNDVKAIGEKSEQFEQQMIYNIGAEFFANGAKWYREQLKQRQ